jgi:hypothetical protein
MMEIYETGLLNREKAYEFKKWLDLHIGTEYDTNYEEDDLLYLVIFDLTCKEVDKIREFELNL